MPNQPTERHFLAEFSGVHNRLRAYLRQLLPTRFDVDEVLQNTSLVLWNKFDQFDPDTNFYHWACVVAKFEVLRYRRKMARDRHVFSEDLLSLLTEEYEEEESRLELMKVALKRCFAKLPAKQQELLNQVYLERDQINTVAEREGFSPTALYKRLARIRQTLKTCITQS